MASLDHREVQNAATAVRVLTMDAVQKAKSGHPGLPMGCAELGALLYGEILKHFPQDPHWIDRDRFVLSAGHGCLLLYSLLHLSGYDLSLEDLAGFRQLGSRTPGHPEYGITPGVETTTGPLGQGIGNAVGMAIAERMLAARFNTPRHAIVDHYTYVLAGDGDMMEGVASEAASLAGHLGLGKLIVFYDSNRITIEGSTALAFSEDVRKRYEAYGWHTQSGSAYDLEGILSSAQAARAEPDRPSLILLESVIAKGAPTKAGSHEAHGAPLGEEEIRLAKRAMGVPEDAFFHVPPGVYEYFAEKRRAHEARYRKWQQTFRDWSRENPGLAAQWSLFFQGADLGAADLPAYKVGDKAPTRKAGGDALNALAKAVPNLVGGSADLAPSNNTMLKGMGSFQKDNPAGRNLHFGVREHGMGAVANGIALHGGLRPYCATFLVFSDYMRPSIRLAAMMKLPVVYVFTHDSIHVGEDGPTHQPIEHAAALRVIPNLAVLRPGDPEETGEAWKMALERGDGPTALLLTRQNLPVYAKADPDWRAQMHRRGAYVVSDSEGEPRGVLVATGSEVSLALQVKAGLGPRIRVVSMVCRELFLRQPQEFRRSLIPGNACQVALEAGAALGWEAVVGEKGLIQAVVRFGESGPGEKVAVHLGLSAEEILSKIKSTL
jgi:transketolase